MSNENLIAILVSAFGLLNVILTIYLSPKIASKFSEQDFLKEKFLLALYDILDYATEVGTLEDLGGVPTKMRQLSLRLQCLFTEGEAPQALKEALEDLFKIVKNAKDRDNSLNSSDKEKIRELLKTIRKESSIYLRNGIK